MIAQAETNGGESSRIGADLVSRVVDSWMPEHLQGSDVVRAVIARRLAAELDTPGLPAYVVPRIAGALVAVIAQIEGVDESITNRSSRDELRDLLKDFSA